MNFVKKDALKRLFLCPWMDGITQGARKAMRLRPWIGPTRYLLLQYLHFHHPWWSYVARSQRPTWMWEGRVTQEQLPRWRCDGFTQIHLILLATTLVSTTPSFASTSCSSSQFDETATVRYIHDGDTLHLTDGRKIRLIGINTPELARDSRPAEAFSAEAKSKLKSLVKDNKSISLVFGADKKDRYGRVLAHTFLADGTNVQAAILERGLASVITIPPNTLFAACYLESERSARCSKIGLWADSAILEAKNLNKKHSGFHLIKGVVNSIKTNSKGVWLNLNDTLTIGIRPKDQKLFDLKKINNMVNQTIIVRGWLNKSKKSTPFYLRIRHPLSIQLASSYSCR